MVADFREGSPTFMKWEKLLINKSNQLLMLIPPGVGNAYYVSSPQAVYHYKLAYTENISTLTTSLLDHGSQRS